VADLLFLKVPVEAELELGAIVRLEAARSSLSRGCEFDAHWNLESAASSVRLQQAGELHVNARARFCALERKKGARSHHPMQHPVPEVRDIWDVVSKLNRSHDHLVQTRR
jgi:hypothetical protein